MTFWIGSVLANAKRNRCLRHRLEAAPRVIVLDTTHELVIGVSGVTKRLEGTDLTPIELHPRASANLITVPLNRTGFLGGLIC